MSKKSSIVVSNKKAHNIKFHKTIWDEINEKAKELNVSISQLLDIIVRKHKGNTLSIKTGTLVPGNDRHNVTLSQNAWDKINEIKESEKQHDLTNGNVIESLFAIYKFKLSPQYLLEDEESSKDIDEKIKKNNEVINKNLKSKFGKTSKKIDLKDAKNKTLYKPLHAYKFLPLLCDFYKTSHDRQYNKNVNKIYASFIPRMTRFKSIDHVVVFGLQGFIIEHLVKDFRDHFFNLSKEEFDHLMHAFEKQILNSTNDKPYINTQKFRELYELGYLPITINALPEGSIVPMKTPVFEVISEGKFNWVGNFLETYMSTELWYPMTIATIALEYRKLVHEFLLKTSDFNPKKDNSLYRMNISEFGSRGNTSFESGVIASAAWSTCGNKSSNVAVESYLKEFYNLDEPIYGMISTEHSVMCSNAAIDGNEKDFIKKLLTELYPTGNLSIVMDSYDYFNVLNKIIPMYKDFITQRDGTLYCRPDSGDPVDNTIKSVQILWRIFGGTTNSKGYKVLDPHIRVMYGDSITIQRARKIFSILEKLKFDITNVSLGAGSFSMLCLEEDGMLKPFTRDSFGFALKTTLVTYMDKDGKEKNVYVFKDPKSDTDHFKKSYRGRILVTKNAKGEYKVSDKHGYQEDFSKCELKPVFKNGQILNFTTLNEIRERLTNYVNKTVKIKNYKGNKSK